MRIFSAGKSLFVAVSAVIIVSFTPKIEAQNLDFMLNTPPNFQFWTVNTGCILAGQGFTGSINQAGSTNPTNRHSIITSTQVDPYTLGQLVVPPPGYSRCAKLGNDQVTCDASCSCSGGGSSGFAERLSYDLEVDDENPILLFKYAVVLEEPTNSLHILANQPAFDLRIFNSSGQQISPSSCTGFSVTANNAFSDGFQQGTTTPGFSQVFYKNWTPVGIDLTPYIGQMLTIDIKVKDCGQGGHFGYMYFVAKEIPAQIQQNFCVGQSSITLTAPEGYTYLWTPGGQTTRTISVNNPTIGSTYSVQLTSLPGCSFTLSTVISPDVVTPSISGPTAVCVGQTVTFTDNSTSSRSRITNREWTLPSGTFVTPDSTATFTPTTPGTYQISYKGINETGCFGTTSIPLIVHPNPVAAFTADTICIGQPVSITNQSSPASNLTYSWSFSNGTTSNLATPTNTIAAPGTYSATLTATDTLTGCDASTTRTFIVLNTPTQTNPQVLGLCKGTTYDLREFVNFVPSVNTSLVQFSGTNVVNGHLWNTAGLAAGLYTVQVSINAPGACPYSGTLSLQLDDIDAQINPVAPVCKGDSLWVSSSSSSALSPLTNFNWYFQGQSYIGGPDSVLFIALNNGTYPLTLAVQNLSGCWDSTTVNVVVHPNPTAQFTPGLSCARIPTAFTSNSIFPSGGPGQYQWIFSDGQNATVANPSVVFAAPGAYSATLWVTDLSTGCTDSASLSFTVEPKPALVPEIIQVCPQTQVDLSDEFSTDIPATITFSGSSIWSVGTRAPGIYYVPVSITSSAGCTYPDTLQIEVLPVPTAVITQIPIQCYNSPTINLLDYVSAPSSTLISFDGAFVTGNFFSFSDAAVGTNTVAIYLIDANTGCRDTLSTTVTVRPRPRIDFTAYHKLCIQTPPFTPWGFKPEGGQLYSPLLDANDQFHPMNAGEGVHAIGYIYCDPYGCCDTVFQDLDVRMDSCSVEMFIPNTFTHNQDGVNDSYRFGYHGVIENFEVEIVNRWGERVFYSEDPDFVWDANNIEGTNEREKLDVYVVRARWTEFKYTDFWEPERRFRRFIGPLYIVR
jgi:PKD repeat protein